MFHIIFNVGVILVLLAFSFTQVQAGTCSNSPNTVVQHSANIGSTIALTTDDCGIFDTDAAGTDEIFSVAGGINIGDDGGN